mgnify:CR=1 FL=1
MIPRRIRKKLPKARLLSIEIGGYFDAPYFAKFRCANFVRWQVGWICVQHRWFWHEDVARRSYPHLFKSS